VDEVFRVYQLPAKAAGFFFLQQVRYHGYAAVYCAHPYKYPFLETIANRAT
jgi:hypothetical protein